MIAVLVLAIMALKFISIINNMPDWAKSRNKTTFTPKKDCSTGYHAEIYKKTDYTLATSKNVEEMEKILNPKTNYFCKICGKKL